jgi:hypothetical protein
MSASVADLITLHCRELPRQSRSREKQRQAGKCLSLQGFQFGDQKAATVLVRLRELADDMAL